VTPLFWSLPILPGLKVIWLRPLGLFRDRNPEQLGSKPGNLRALDSRPAEVLSQAIRVVGACFADSRGRI